MFKFLLFIALFYMLYRSVYQPFVLQLPKKDKDSSATNHKRNEYTDYEEID